MTTTLPAGSRQCVQMYQSSRYRWWSGINDVDFTTPYTFKRWYTMGEKTLVETIYGKHHKYEVMKEGHTIGATKYFVYRDGKPYKGSFSSLSDAVEAAKKEG